MPRRISFKDGFTLVEMLTVIALIALLAGLTLPAIKDQSASRKLRSGGDTIMTLGQLARQNSLGRNTLTALVISKLSASPADGLQRVGVMALEAREDGIPPVASDWKPIGAWRKLPQGVLVSESESTLFSAPQHTPEPGLPVTIQAGGEALRDYVALVFTPNGRLLADNAVTIKLVPAISQNGSLVINAAKEGNSSANYAKVFFIASTGQIRLEQP